MRHDVGLLVNFLGKSRYLFVHSVACFLPVYALVTLILAFGVGCEQTGVSPGRTAPAIELLSLEGTHVTLDSFRGKVVLINFWASWCGPCLEEIPALRQFYETLSPKGVVVLGIGVDDSRENLLRMQKQYGIPFPTLMDPGGSLKSLYRVTGVPETFVVDRSGKIMMLVDPLSGEPVAKFTGPRPWNAASFLELFGRL